jgi:hypothetical protein
VNILHHSFKVAGIEVFEHQIASGLPGISVLSQGDTEVVCKQIVSEVTQLRHIMDDPVSKALGSGFGYHTLLIYGIESTIESGPDSS